MSKRNTSSLLNKWGRSGYTLIVFALVLLGIVFVNIIISFTYTRFDFTEDNLYSLSDETKELLSNDSAFSQPVYFKIYLAGDLPADLEKIRIAVAEKLSVFRKYAGNKIRFDFIDPNSFGSDEMNKKEKIKIYNEGQGLQPSDFQLKNSGEVSVKTVWGGAVVEYNGKTKDYIQFFEPRKYPPQADLKSLATRAISQLEYNLIHSIRKIIQKKKKKIGFLHGHGELTKQQTQYIRRGLYDKYKLEDVSVDSNINALQGMQGLVVAKPQKRFSERDKFVIDQFIMRGGKVMWFVDPVEVRRDSLYYNGRTMGLNANLNLEDLFFNYGVRMEKHLVMDTVSAPIYVPQHPKEFLEWIFYPRIMTNKNNHPIVKNIAPVKTEYTSSLTKVGSDSIKKTTLLKTSPGSGIMRTPARIDFQFVENPPNINNQKSNQGFPVAVLLEGSFSSLFKNRLTKEFTAGIEKTSFEYRKDIADNKMIVVSDGDVIRNEVDSSFKRGKYRYKALPLDVDLYGIKTSSGMPKYTYGNGTMAVNMVDYLLDEYSLISVRSKKIKPRRIQEMNQDQESFWSWFNLFTPIIFVTLVVGLMVYDRRRKYAK